MTVPHPGTSELGWLADLKEPAEQVGSTIFGEPIRWDVEVLTKSSPKRPDVVIRRDSTGEALASGEAKRPDTPRGVHPLVATEVRDAITKAQTLGVPVCFTTNFFEAAVFDARDRPYSADLDRIQGGIVPIISPTVAKADAWWSSYPTSERVQLVLLGLRQLFERLRAARAQVIPRDINEVALHVFSRTTERLVAPLTETFINERNNEGLESSLLSHGLRVHLNPADNQQARFLVAQGVAEVLTAALFYRNIHEYFELPDLLAGTNPSTANAFVNRIQRSLKLAEDVSGDYEPIFQLSPIARWCLRSGGAPVLQHWKNLAGFIDQIDFSSVTSDILGSIFERLISPERRHSMGQHYTAARVAASMIHWALDASDDVIADLACGAGTFLVEAYRKLATAGKPHTAILKQLFGNDLDPFAVHLASVNLATRDIYKGSNYPIVSLSDAFELKPGSLALDVHPANGPAVQVEWPIDRFGAVVGNPPYALGPDDLAHVQTALSRLGSPAPKGLDAGNLAAWFMLLADVWIRPRGKIALVMPTAVLQNSNLAFWRQWLRTNFDAVVWHAEDDVWFSDARVGVCVILAQRMPEPGIGKLHFVDVLDRIEGGLASVDGTPSPVQTARVRDLSSLPVTDDIYVAGAYPTPLQTFRDAARTRLLSKLQGVKVYSGNKLGHPFYQLRNLGPPTSTAVLREVEGYKMRLRLNRNYLTPFLTSPKDERTGEFTTSPWWVLSAPEKLGSGALRTYINSARVAGAGDAPSVKQRGQHWWSVDWRTTQVAVQIHPGFLHQVWWSPEPFVAKNNFHVLEFTNDVSQIHRELIAASLASAFGALGALFLSSEVGCEGVRWLSTEQFELWPVLDPTKVNGSQTKAILQSYQVFRRQPAVEIPAMDSGTIDMWRNLTVEVAKAAGIADAKVVAQQAIDLCRSTCVRRTQRETLALAGRFRIGGGVRSTLGRHIQTELAKLDEVDIVLDLLTSGPQTLRLQESSPYIQGTLNLGSLTPPSPPGLDALTLALRPGFECAPLIDEADPESLGRRIQGILQRLTEDLVGPPPPENESGSSAYREIAYDIKGIAVRWIQQQVRGRLS